MGSACMPCFEAGATAGALSLSLCGHTTASKCSHAACKWKAHGTSAAGTRVDHGGTHLGLHLLGHFWVVLQVLLRLLPPLSNAFALVVVVRPLRQQPTYTTQLLQCYVQAGYGWQAGSHAMAQVSSKQVPGSSGGRSASPLTLRSTTWVTSAASSTHPSALMPRPYMMSNSATPKGAAICSSSTAPEQGMGVSTRWQLQLLLGEHVLACKHATSFARQATRSSMQHIVMGAAG